MGTNLIKAISFICLGAYLFNAAPSAARPARNSGVEFPVDVEIRINGQDGAAVVTAGESALVSMKVTPREGDSAADVLEWWVPAGSEQFGWYWYGIANGNFSTTTAPAAREALLNNGETFFLPDMGGLPPAEYQVYLGVDSDPNGILDMASLAYSRLDLRVVAEKQSRFVYESDFGTGLDGWTAGAADLPADYDPEIYELGFSHEQLPDEVVEAYEFGPMLQGHNRSDDLFMYMIRPLTGLKHNTEYVAVFNIEIASNAAAGGVGIGGAPGESVFFKAGIATQKPAPQVTAQNYYRMNVDHGIQSNDGEDAVVLNHIGVETMNGEYKLKTMSNDQGGFPFTTGSGDRVWILIGTDSGFEGFTRLYIPRIEVVIEEVSTP